MCPIARNLEVVGLPGSSELGSESRARTFPKARANNEEMKTASLNLPAFFTPNWGPGRPDRHTAVLSCVAHRLELSLGTSFPCHLYSLFRHGPLA